MDMQRKIQFIHKPCLVSWIVWDGGIYFGLYMEPSTRCCKGEKQESNPFFCLRMVAYGPPVCMALQPITPVDIAPVMSSVFLRILE
jgi:hypothetical protein